MKRLFLISIVILSLISCKKSADTTDIRVVYSTSKFVMGADISYANQILDHGGVYKDSGNVEDPYVIFSKYGTNVIRFRLFYNPVWTKEVYGTDGIQMYNDFNDVKKGIGKAKAAGMKVCLDFHYSDTWAGTSNQVTPAAWQSLSLSVLSDSLYAYTYRTLHELGTAGLMPEFVQVGNEINPGLLLPLGDRWNGNEKNMITLLNSAISATRTAGATGSINPKIIIHVAQPEDARAWFNGLADDGLSNYDIIGISYYYMWSSSPLSNISNFVSMLKTTFHKDVMIMETTYPWTTGWDDNYTNQINTSALVSGYPATEAGQYKYLHALTQEVIDGGGIGIFTWEPDWITSQMKDPWGIGSSWECNTFFDFEGNSLKGIRFMSDKYNF
ncbi:MAG: glycosyl hydrolase 53 family protein [Bacteroidales bacterium]